VAEGERDIPRWLRHRDRAVSADDFADIVRQTPGVAIGRVDVRPLFHPEIGTPAPGVVTILVVPDDPLNPDAPQPNRLFLQAVCNYLEPRRLLTTEIHVAGPDYQAVSVSIGIDVVAGLEIPPVREGVKAAIRDFLSPLRGGFAQVGWPLDTPVDDRELWARAARVDGVARVRSLRLFDADGNPVDRVEVSGLQLPRLLRVAVAVGDAEDLAPPQTAAPVKRVPVPVLPPAC
jgi:predicted phage baseplate assembly protein